MERIKSFDKQWESKWEFFDHETFFLAESALCSQISPTLFASAARAILSRCQKNSSSPIFFPELVKNLWDDLYEILGDYLLIYSTLLRIHFLLRFLNENKTNKLFEEEKYQIPNEIIEFLQENADEDTSHKDIFLWAAAICEVTLDSGIEEGSFLFELDRITERMKKLLPLVAKLKKFTDLVSDIECMVGEYIINLDKFINEKPLRIVINLFIGKEELDIALLKKMILQVEEAFSVLDFIHQRSCKIVNISNLALQIELLIPVPKNEEY